MPVKVQADLPVKEILESENIFVMDETRAVHQDIRPLKIMILNLMPLKEDTELQLLRSLSNTSLQVDVTGAPVEQMEFEEVDYWDELTKIMDWTNTHVTSTMFLCWGAQASLYHFYGLKKRMLPEKKFGLFWHKVNNRKIPLVRGFDDEFLAPHSRHTEVPIDDIRACKDVTILAESDEAGFYLGMAEEGRKIFVMGHPEYDRMTLDGEYHRDKDKGLPIEIPKNYYKNDDPNTKPVLLWRSHANNLYTNWLNYYVYQVTPYNLDGTPDFSGK